MILDLTIQKIINQILLEIKLKYGVDYSTEEIFEVANIQIEATKLGLKEGFTIHWTRFCKFVYTRRGERKSEVIKFKNKLETLKEDLTPEETHKLINDFINSSAKEKREHLANASLCKYNNITLAELEDKIQNRVIIKTFKPLM